MANRVESLVEELAREFLQGTEIEFVDVEYVKEHHWYLRVYIDKEGGIDIEDCQWLSELLEKKLDALDPIPESYFLEVSSPGLDRELKKARDFDRHKGDQVEVSLYAPLDGRKTIVGELRAYTDDAVTVGEDVIARDKIAKIRLYVEF